MIHRLKPAGDLDTSRPSIDGREYAAQKIKQVLSTFRGEWFLDTSVGIPWWEDILTKNPSFELIRGIIRQAILSVPGITDVPELVVNEPDADRVASIFFIARYQDGSQITDSLQVRIV